MLFWVSTGWTSHYSESGDTTVSLEEKIGQMIIMGFRGLRVDGNHRIIKDIREHHLGGVILFDIDVPSMTSMRNIESPSQVKILVDSLQTASPVPLLIAIDYEGGVITRLKTAYGFPLTYTAEYIGTRDDTLFTAEHAQRMARTLAGLGINLNLAPVVDLNVNPDNPIIAKNKRSFSSDPEIVVKHARIFINALHREGIPCALKHFPGHGSSTEDSHLGYVDVSHTWSALELKPYADLINAGLVDAIMTAHVFNAQLDSLYPATLSKSTLSDKLRGDLNYDGVVISDDMQMQAIAGEYGLEVALYKAVQSGIDLLLFCNNSRTAVSRTEVVVRTIKMLIESGKIDIKRIDESYRRIKNLKKKWLHVKENTGR